MKFFIYLYISNILIPLLTMAAGYFMYKHTPKNINSFIGYRTSLSKKNQDVWEFSNKYAGKVMLITGSVLLILSVIVPLFFIHTDENIFSTFFTAAALTEVGILLCTLIPMNNKIKRTFDENGNRRK